MDTEIERLYSLEILAQMRFSGSQLTERIPQEKEIRSQRKLDLLDAFADIINGTSVCTACYLSESEGILYVSVNGGDNLERTVKFANEVWADIQKITSIKRKEDLDHIGTDRLLTKILMSRQNYITNILRRKTRATLRKFVELMQNNDINNSFVSMLSLKSPWNLLDERKILMYIKDADSSYDTIRSKSDNTPEEKSLLNFLRSFVYIRWNYQKIVRCMIRFSVLGLNTFASITKVVGAPWMSSTTPQNVYIHQENIVNEGLDSLNKPIVYNTALEICQRLKISFDKVKYDDILAQWEFNDTVPVSNVSIHAEISLMCYLLEKGVIHGEIGTSKLCCVLCDGFTKQLTARSLAEFNYSGRHGKFYPGWAYPPCPNPAFEKTFHTVLSDMATLVFIIYMNSFVGKREGDEMMPGKDSDVYSNTYSDDDLGHVDI